MNFAHFLPVTIELASNAVLANLTFSRQSLTRSSNRLRHTASPNGR